MRLRTAKIIEAPDGWYLDGVRQETAMDALLSVRQQDAVCGFDCVTVVEWTTTSKIGKAIVMVIGGQTVRAGA